MISFRILCPLFMMCVASASSTNRRLEILDEMKQGIFDQFQLTGTLTNDKTSTCLGESFTGISAANYDYSTIFNDLAALNAAVFVGRYSNAVDGKTYTCTATCAGTEGFAFMQAHSSANETIDATTEFEGSSGGGSFGCKGGLAVAITAARSGNLFVILVAEKGITSGKVTCTQVSIGDGNNGVNYIQQKLATVFGLGGGNRRLNKYIRGSQWKPVKASETKTQK